MSSWCWIGPIAVGYTLGSIPTGYWIGRVLRGIDIRHFGSGNLGATNVLRVLGWKAGAVTLTIDAAKGVMAVKSSIIFANLCAGVPAATAGALPWAGGLSAIAGHSFSPFVRFRGGKGVATTAGVFAALLPFEAALAIGSFFSVLIVTRIVSLSSILAAMVLVLSTCLHSQNPVKMGVVSSVATFIIWRHRDNIKRLRAGTEPRIQFSIPVSAPSRKSESS